MVVLVCAVCGVRAVRGMSYAIVVVYRRKREIGSEVGGGKRRRV